jgi:23S rRNA (cytosine1962-C5)-methyltransferase
VITLKKKSDRRIRQGHLWVFSNEIESPPVAALQPGSIHELCDSTGEFLGIVYANPGSLITARILSKRKIPIDTSFFRERIQMALAFRSRLSPKKDAYRVVFGEADKLPGLIVDRYGDFLAVQSLTAGMDELLGHVLEALVDTISPQGIYLRNDSPYRLHEGLQTEKRLAYGDIPDLVPINSWGLEFLVDIRDGQKTGFFLDQEWNRTLIRQYLSPGAQVLDLFCYTGAWGIHALDAGATQVTAVDASRPAIDLALSNATLNKTADRFVPTREPVLDFLKKARNLWDFVVVDPPAFVKSRSRLKDGLKGYIDVNRRALTKMESGGILITCSCSHHLDLQTFEQAIFSASRQSGRELKLLDSRGQGPDHPVLISMPETRYLKVLVAQVN